MRNMWLATALLFATAGAHAQSRPEPVPREIVVSGEAEVKVVPDQVILTVAVETLDRELLVAKQQNDERVKKVLAVTQQFKIEPKHVQTNQITIEPRYKDYKNDPANFTGFAVRKSVVVCVKDMERFEAILLALLKAGTNRVEGVQFQSTELRKHRDAARLLAVRAAREKATAMATELGQKVARPRSIVENSTELHTAARSAYQNVSNNVASASESSGEGGFSPGQISISASVTVHFDLAD